MSLRKLFFALVLIAAGAAAGYHLPPAGGPEMDGHSTAAPVSVEKAERKVLYWYDPMYPGTHFDKPGQSPFMDMALVPRYDEEDQGSGIRIDPAQVQNLAVRTEKVAWGALAYSRDIPANVEFNAYQLARVQPRTDGFVEKIYALAVGDIVQSGDMLADIIVPGWASDQSEYLLLKSQNADARIVRGVRERLRLTGMPEEMLNAVDATGKVQTRMSIQAPIGGVITSLDVYPGMNVDKAMTIATIQGTNPVWVTADVPERDIHLVTAGKKIRVALSAFPERVFYGESFVLLPKADQETRTVPMRLSLDNPEGILRPGLTASIRLRGTDEEAFLIPTQGLIDLGEEQRVITRAADGSFVPKRVQVLRNSRDKTSVLSGVEVGDDVVVSGLFLIDSEANLRGALARMRGNAEENQ